MLINFLMQTAKATMNKKFDFLFVCRWKTKEKTTLKIRIISKVEEFFSTALTVQTVKKLQIRFMNLAVDISLYYLSWASPHTTTTTMAATAASAADITDTAAAVVAAADVNDLNLLV